jgi:hypothetical protein
MPSPLRLLWTAEVAHSLTGLALAREGGRFLAWDLRHGLYLFDAEGQRLAHCPAPPGMAGAACAADASRVAAVGAAGQVWSFGADLTPRWERTVKAPGVAVALDSFGDRVAVADGAGGLHLFDRDGRPAWRAACLRPLRFLAFVAEAAFVVGSADFGLVACHDHAGRCSWRDAPVAHTGSLAASGDGGVVALACYSEGLYCYGLSRVGARIMSAAAPCRLADVSYDGRTFLTAGLDDRVCLRSTDGTVLADWACPARPVAVALAPLGERAVVALADGRVQALARHER